MVAVQHLDRLLEPFERAHLGIVARQDARRREQLDEQLRHRRQQAIHALRQRLHDQVVAVAIDDERRQQIGFAVHQPVGGRVELQRCRGTGSPVSSRARSSDVVDRLPRRASASGSGSATDR